MAQARMGTHTASEPARRPGQGRIGQSGQGAGKGKEEGERGERL